MHDTGECYADQKSWQEQYQPGKEEQNTFNNEERFDVGDIDQIGLQRSGPLDGKESKDEDIQTFRF